eukprot:scaffold2140_cov394-Prasinococcus_capsulatus_cf.AAC.6
MLETCTFLASTFADSGPSGSLLATRYALPPSATGGAHWSSSRPTPNRLRTSRSLPVATPVDSHQRHKASTPFTLRVPPFWRPRPHHHHRRCIR